jgi:uncharacterized protein (TIGR02147 family)
MTSIFIRNSLGQNIRPRIRLRSLAWRLEASYYECVKTKVNELIPQLSPSSGFRLYLQSEFAKRLSTNPQYSLRSFAMQLGINHSTVSQLLRGKRALTPRMIKTLGGRLGLRPEEIEAFIARERQASETVVSREIRWLTMETVALLSDSSHRTILEMTSMEGFVPDTRWIARALDLTVDEVNMALSRLTRLGLLEMASADRWVDRSEAGLSNRDGFAQQVIRRLSEQARRLSGAKEEEATGGKISSAARIEISAAHLPAVMELIERLRREAPGLQPDEKEYRLEINLTPIYQNTQTKEH